MRLVITLSLLAVPLLVARADIYSYPQLWQIGGFSLDELDRLSGGPMASTASNPAAPTPAGWTVMTAWQAQNGHARETSVEAVPRHAWGLPQLAGVSGHWHELDARFGFQQLFNVHEQAWIPTQRDTTWQDYNSRLEALCVELGAELVGEEGWRPAVRLGAGWSRYRLVVDQVEVQRKLFADGWLLGLQASWRQLGAGLTYREKTVWNHWSPQVFDRWGESQDTVQVWAVLPAQWKADLRWEMGQGWSSEARISWTDWSSSLLGLQDRTEAALFVRKSIPVKRLNLQGGLCSSGSTAVEGSQLEWLFQDEQSTWFLLGGVEKQLSHGVTARLGVADSHLGTGSARRQTLVQAGVEVSLEAILKK